MSEIESPTKPTPLHVLGGADAPADLAPHLTRIAELGVPARKSLWLVVGPALPEPVTPEAERKLDAFAAEHRLARELLGGVVKALRFVLRSASRVDASKQQLEDDLRALGCPDDARELVASRYEDAKRDLRREILTGSLGDHGKLCVGIDWRVDQMLSSDRGEQLGAPVLFLTMHYREGDEKHRITMQVLPETLASLKAVCERFTR